ncbi:hypothetical protein LA6_005091 [Marinibacterium anthonyi]|nr:hypothetical protein LA6_005091 [Marinibacterium anthonyi]|tara:strand:+ start:1670 stop:1816 length:147 start_codon:yes stop_codon:yes gene_type:complete
MRMIENLKVALLVASILLGALAGHSAFGPGPSVMTECVPCADRSIADG